MNVRGSSKEQRVTKNQQNNGLGLHIINATTGVKQLNNNFMVSGTQAATTKVETMGQKTAYGFVGGVNG